MTLQTRIAQIPDFFLDLLFPRLCVGCGKESDFLCDSCIENLPKLEAPYCTRCGIPLTDNSCPKCKNWTLDIDGIRSLFLHEGLMRDVAHALKYNNIKSLAKPLAQLMAKYLDINPIPADVLIAVPMHSKRLRKRGYNQAQLIAQELAKLIQLPISEGAIIRVKDTISQVSLGAEDRRKNVDGAFQCTDTSLSNKRILLIDDVCTTGATMNSCSFTLKQAGASSVWGLTFSRDC